MNLEMRIAFENTMNLLAECKRRAYMRISDEGPRAHEEILSVAEEYVRSWTERE